MRVVRGLVGLLGELLITAGAFLLLFVGWQLFWTDVVSDADAAQEVTVLQNEFDNGTAIDPGSGPKQPKKVPIGDAFAIIRIPRFGASFARPLYEGTTRDVLQRGVGHYVGTAWPGQVGNFSMAGHRTTYGKPFSKIATLQVGDVVLAETKSSWFVYKVTGHEIVDPTQSSVILPVPNDPGAVPKQKLLTMTSCHPEFTARQRYVIHAKLAATYTHSEGVPPEVLEVAG